jgi:hypothetical protein
VTVRGVRIRRVRAVRRWRQRRCPSAPCVADQLFNATERLIGDGGVIAGDGDRDRDGGAAMSGG